MLIPEVKRFIETEQLLQPNDQVLVAVSAGVDSVVLSCVLNELGYSINIAHVNFQLRGDASDEDEQLVERLAGKLRVPYHVTRFETAEYAKNQGMSTQMAARELRYQWFEQIRVAHNYQLIATAHHLNDVLETILLNFTRGAGIAGFHGILPKRGKLIRPLLSVTKEQVIWYANSQGLRWREDQSNSSDYYQRNLIRNQVVPLLKEINPNLETTTRNTVEIIRSVEARYYKSLEETRNELCVKHQQHIRILKSKLYEFEPAILADLLRDYGFNLEQCRALIHQALENTGSVFNSPTHVLNVDRQEIIISPLPAREAPTVIESIGLDQVKIGAQRWQLAIHPRSDYDIRSDPWLGAFDLDRIHFPLTVRNWSAGDRFYPLGMGGAKKISDFLIDCKVPYNYKNEVRVLVSKGEIVWVVGHRVDDRYKITDKTRKVLEISVDIPSAEVSVKRQIPEG